MIITGYWESEYRDPNTESATYDVKLDKLLNLRFKSLINSRLNLKFLLCRIEIQINKSYMTEYVW